MGYFHQVIIDHVGHVVGRELVRLDEHEIAEFVRLEGDFVTYAVVEGYGPGLGDAEPDDRNVGISPGLGLLLRYVPAPTIVARVLFMLGLLVPYGFQALRRAIAMEGCTTVKQLVVRSGRRCPAARTGGRDRSRLRPRGPRPNPGQAI